MSDLPTESILEETPDLIPMSEENTHESIPHLIPCIDEETDEETDDDSMPELTYCMGDSCVFTITQEAQENNCSSFGIEYKNIQEEQLIDYNDEEIEQREERYENWKGNRRTFYPKAVSPLFKEKR